MKNLKDFAVAFVFGALIVYLMVGAVKVYIWIKTEPTITWEPNEWEKKGKKHGIR